MKSERVTLKMIAERAGTSIGTVDRAIHNRGGISAESRRAVLHVARELGYRPNKFASALGRKRTIRIGMVYPNQPADFYRDVDLGIDRSATELRDYGILIEKIRYSSQDSAVAAACLQSIDAGAYDALAVNAAGGSAVVRSLNALAARLPVATFNTDAPESQRLFYVGSDARQSGRMGGELLALLLGGRGNVAVLGNFARAPAFVERFGGFCEFLQSDYPAIQIYSCSESCADSGAAAHSLLTLLERSPDIDGVFCTSYSSTVGAVAALRKLGRRDIRLVGYDPSEKTNRAVVEGWCAALIYQAPFQHGYQAAHLLAQHILEGWLPDRPRLHLESRIVLKSNIHSYDDEFRFANSILR